MILNVNRQSGFSLLELLVYFALFTLIVIALFRALFESVPVLRYAATQRRVQDRVNATLNLMAKDAFSRKIISASNDCTNPPEATTSNRLILDFSGPSISRVEYYVDSGILYRVVDGVSQSLISSDVEVMSFRFCVTGIAGVSQKKVTVFFKALSTDTDVSAILESQMTLSERYIGQSILSS